MLSRGRFPLLSFRNQNKGNVEVELKMFRNGIVKLNAYKFKFKKRERKNIYS